MKRITLCIAMATALGFGLGMPLAHASTFNYHGTLQDAGQAANGTYEMRLTLYSGASGGSVMAGPVTVYGIDVKEGSFVTSVDFGPLSLTSQGWLGVEVKAGGGDYVALDARSPVAPEASACPGSWALDGNAGIPSGSYLGTADASPVYIQSNGIQNAKFWTNGGVGLGYSYVPQGANSIALGYSAGTVYDGSIVTGGKYDTFNATIRDTATNQVILVAEHGVGINTAKAPDGTPLRDELTIAVSPSLPGDYADLVFETSSSAAQGYKGFNMGASPTGRFVLNGINRTVSGVDYDSLIDVQYFGPLHYGAIRLNGATNTYPLAVGYSALSGNGAYLSAAGVWTNASSRTFKDAFASIDPVNVLDKLVAMPVMTWFYKGNHDDGQHIGPVAEDFAKVFGFGENEKYIGTVDESGVALAAIQGLNKKLEIENAGLHSKLDALTARLDKLESRRGE